MLDMDKSLLADPTVKKVSIERRLLVRWFSWSLRDSGVIS